MEPTATEEVSSSISHALLLAELQKTSNSSILSKRGFELIEKLKKSGSAQRDLNFIDKRAETIKIICKKRYKAEGALTQALGMEQLPKCAHCAAGAFADKFDECVQVTSTSSNNNSQSTDGNDVSKACSNCRYRNEQSYCTLATQDEVTKEAILRIIKLAPKHVPALVISSPSPLSLEAWKVFVDKEYGVEEPDKSKHYWYANEIMRRVAPFFPSDESNAMLEDLCPIEEVIETYTTLEMGFFGVMETVMEQQQIKCGEMAKKLPKGQWESATAIYGRATYGQVVMKMIMRERDETWKLLKIHPLNQFIEDEKDALGDSLVKGMTFNYFNRRYTALITHITGCYNLQAYEHKPKDKVGTKEPLLMLDDSGEFQIVGKIIDAYKLDLALGKAIEKLEIDGCTLAAVNSTMYTKLLKAWVIKSKASTKSKKN